MAEELRVEKLQEQVSLFMADGVVFEGVVFLAQYALHHTGAQTVLDLLLENDPFLPMKVRNGEFQLVRKGMISHLRCPVEIEQGLKYLDCAVRISFIGNEVLQGVVKMNLPEHRARLTNYINDGNEFFPLFADDHAYLVNRSLIRNIVLIN